MSQSIEQVLLNIAVNLNAHQPTYRHYQKLLDGLQQVLPCDASALFILDDAQNLVPVAINGLSMAVLGRKFSPQEHPRLEMIMQSRLPVRFPESSSLPDPFDGLLSEDDEASIDVHSCMGCSLYVGEALVGVLTIDALASGAFKKSLMTRLPPLLRSRRALCVTSACLKHLKSQSSTAFNQPAAYR